MNSSARSGLCLREVPQREDRLEQPSRFASIASGIPSLYSSRRSPFSIVTPLRLVREIDVQHPEGEPAVIQFPHAPVRLQVIHRCYGPG